MKYAAIMLFVVALCTYLTRALPFWLFRRGELPSAVSYLGKILPGAIMATLVVYCLRGTTLASVGGFLPQLIAVAAVTGLHLWRRNTLLSIFGGTAVYMLLVQNFIV